MRWNFIFSHTRAVEHPQPVTLITLQFELQLYNMRTPLMAGNWKMYKTAPETTAFFDKFKPLVEKSTHCDIAICPTFVNIAAAVEAARGTRIGIGAQNMFWAKEGAYTGEI